jgi:hypothetical protein
MALITVPAVSEKRRSVHGKTQEMGMAARTWWCMSVIPAIQEVEIGRIEV